MSKREILKRQAGVTLTKVSIYDENGRVADFQYVVHNEKAPLTSQNFGSLEDAERLFQAELLRGSPNKKQF